MVRFKSRYLVLRFDWKHLKAEDSPGEAQLLRAFKDSIQTHYGDDSLKKALPGLQLKWYSPYSGVCVLRCGRDIHKQCLDSIQRLISIAGRSVQVQLLRLTGAVRCYKAAALQHDRRLLPQKLTAKQASMEAPAAASIKLVTWNKDVYEPSDDSFALVDAVHSQLSAIIKQPPKLALEIGCGSGYVICSFALALREAGLQCCLMGTDINPKALEATAATLNAHQVSSVDLLQTDLLSGLIPRLQGQVDVLLFNPPYVPSPDEELLGNGISRAWAGGERGRRIIDRLLAQLGHVLAPGGQLFMVTVTENDPKGIVERLSNNGFTSSIILIRGADEELLQVVHAVKRYTEQRGSTQCILVEPLSLNVAPWKYSGSSYNNYSTLACRSVTMLDCAMP